MWHVTCFGFLRDLFFFLFYFILWSCTACTSKPILTFYTSFDVFPHKKEPFSVMFILHHILAVKYPPKPQFGGRNRHFPAKRAKYSNFCQSHCSDSNQILHNNKDFQILFAGCSQNALHKSKIVDGCHLEKIINHYISAIVWLILTSTRHMTYFCARMCFSGVALT